MLYKEVDIGLNLVSCVKRAEFLNNLLEARCLQEELNIFQDHLRDEATMWLIRNFILPSFYKVK